MENITDNDTQRILMEIINEAVNGSVMIDDYPTPIGFNTNISQNQIFRSEENLCELNIEDISELVTKLDEYIELNINENRKLPYYSNNTEYKMKKTLISYLFANATPNEFENPIEFINRQISFLKDKKLKKFDNSVIINMNGILSGNDLIVKNSNQSVQMETPHKFEISISNGIDIYKLPEISYGIVRENDEDVCYIYSIIDKSKQERTPYIKTISRLLYKLNAGIEESDEFQEYKNGKSDYYPENITDVTMSSVLSLSIFLGILNNENVSKIKGVTYLPLRYHSRDVSKEHATDEKKKEELSERNDRIQHNATEKFIRTFRRLETMIPQLEIITYPYEYDEYLTCIMKNNLTSENQMINDVESTVKKGTL